MMKKFFVTLLVLGSFNVLAQTPRATSDMIPHVRKVPCCAQCSGPNAHLNASILDNSTKPATCKPQNGNGNGNQPWQVVYVKSCTNRVVQNHKACGGSAED